MTQQRAKEQQYQKESGEMIQVKNILKAYDHSKQAFVQQNILHLNDDIGTKIRQTRLLNTKLSNPNKELSYSQNAVRQVYDKETIKISEQNNFNFDNSKNNSQNKKFAEQSIKLFPDIHSKDQISLMYDKMLEQNDQFSNILTKLIKNNKQKTQPARQSSIGNLQQRIRTYSQEVLKNNKVQKLPDVEDYRKSTDFNGLKLTQKRSSMAENPNISPSKDIKFKQKYTYSKSNEKNDPQITHKKRIEQIDKNWQELLKENDFI